MVTKWFPLPTALLVDPAEPYLLSESKLGELRDYLSSVQASYVEIDLGDAQSVAEIIGSLKAVLPFPDWCGSNWDAIEDAFEETRQELRFPLVVIAHGLKPLMDKIPHLALEVVIRMSGLSQAFSVAGDQFIVMYPGIDWANPNLQH